MQDQPLNTSSEANLGKAGDASVEQRPIEASLEKGPTDEKPKEISIVQEQPLTQPSIPATAANDDQTNDQTTKPVAEEAESKEEFSGRVDPGIGVWTKKCKDVIKQNVDKPFSEEEAAEELQIQYLDTRFGVKINKKEHEIK